MNVKASAKQIKTYIPAIFIAMRKNETPPAAKIMAMITVAYALSPIDLIPDFIPVLGYIDDLIILPLFIALTIKLIPPEIMEICKSEADGLWQKGRPKKWYYALPIIILWIILITAIIGIIIHLIHK